MKYFFIILLAFFICACSIKNQNFTSQSLAILIVSPVIKINDTAFLKKENKNLDLEVYKLGQAFFKLKIKDKICLNSVCYDKKIFNQKFFKNEYYEDILSDILNAKALWQGKNLQKTNCGFEQNLKTKSYEIIYQVCNDKVVFLDKILRIKIILNYFKK